jgi:hypothetical protein
MFHIYLFATAALSCSQCKLIERERERERERETEREREREGEREGEKKRERERLFAPSFRPPLPDTHSLSLS